MTRPLLDRLGIAPEHRTTRHWEPIAFDVLESEKRELVRRRCKAVALYVETTRPLAEIRKDTGISDDELRRLVRRCFHLGNDGEPFGFRALLPNFRVGKYTRTKSDTNKPGGHAGLFDAMLAKYPDVKKFIEKKAFGKKTEFGPPEKAAKISTIHRLMLKKLRKLGAREDQYPFNAKNRGYDALRRFVSSLSDGHAKQFAENYTLARDRSMQGDPSTARRPITDRPYERVEVDAHTEDCHLAIDIPTPQGLLITAPMERLSLIVVIDRASRAALGYDIGFGRSYNSDDIDSALTNAIVPWKPRQLSIPELTYPTGSGLPSGVIPDCAWRLWNMLSMDNAWAHMSLNTRDQLTRRVRCAINFGEVATPAARDIVERFFGTIAPYMHRLPSTTGSNTRDARRTDSEGNALKYGIKLEHMLQVMDVLIATYNVTPHQGLPGQLSPLQFLRTSLAQGDIPRQVFNEDRPGFSLSWMRVPLNIRGSLRNGKRPYIQFKNAIYTNPIIADTPSLIGRPVIGEIDRRDARTMRIYLPSGESLGVVEAVGQWGLHPHTLRQRELLTTRHVMRHLALDGHDDFTNPMDAWLKYLATKAPSSKKMAAKYAELVYSVGTDASSQLIAQPPQPRNPPSGRSRPDKREFDPLSEEWVALSRTVTR